MVKDLIITTSNNKLRLKGNKELMNGIETCVKFANINRKLGYEKIILY